MTLVRNHPLLSILLLALGLRLGVYIVVNYWIFGGEIEHPDSYFYFEKGQALGTRWRTGDLAELFSFRYEDMIGLMFVILPHTRIVPELVNVIASTLTAGVGYLTVLKIVASGPVRFRGNASLAALFVGFMLAVDPYQVYLSTQMLKEALYVFALSVLFYGLVSDS